jgi:hypothetical protein
MAKDLAELIVKVGIQIAEWFNNRKKEKKGDCLNDRQGTTEKK